MLEVVARALRSPSARLIKNSCQPYQNEKGEWGYCMTVWDAGHYHMISISHTNDAPTPEEVGRPGLTLKQARADAEEFLRRTREGRI